MILCDPPYGTTKNKWDTQLDLDKMWAECERIIKPKGAMVFFSQQPFTSKLVMSNPKLFKYEWVWHKPMATGFLNSKHAPMKCHENICVFSKGAASPVRDENRAMWYFPQMGTGDPYVRIRGSRDKKTYGNFGENAIISDGTRYPRDVITFKHPKDKNHPTAKPVDLLEYLIRTYTPERERERAVVLDFCAGSGSTGEACLKTGRDFIGIEMDEKYFNIMKNRLLTSDN